VGPSIVSDFWIGIRGNKSLAWGSSTGNVLGIGQNGLPEKVGSISVDFYVTDFNAGTTVNYEVFYNEVSQGTGSFIWSGSDENFIGLDSRDGNSVSFDNFAVTLVPEPSTAALALLGIAGLWIRRRNA
jgi:hypothetical protein